MQFQEITAAGTVYGAPRMNTMPDGQAVCNFFLMVDEPGGTGARLTKIGVSVLGKNAGKAWAQLKAGDELVVIGRANANLYEDADGKPQAELCIRAHFLRYAQDVLNRNQARGAIRSE